MQNFASIDFETANGCIYRFYRNVRGSVGRMYCECGGYDELDMLEMMYPNEDVDSEDFDDGFDLEDFYED